MGSCSRVTRVGPCVQPPRLVRDPSDLRSLRDTHHAPWRVAVLCAALPPRLGESPLAALVELEVDYPRFEFARTTAGVDLLG